MLNKILNERTKVMSIINPPTSMIQLFICFKCKNIVLVFGSKPNLLGRLNSLIYRSNDQPRDWPGDGSSVGLGPRRVA